MARSWTSARRAVCYRGTTRPRNLDAAGGWLSSEWAAYVPSGKLWSDSFNPAEPLTTPSHLNVASPAVLGALANAVVNLETNKIPLNASYGQVQHATRNGVKIPIPGCDTGCFNAIYAADGQGDRSVPPPTERYTTVPRWS